MTITTGPPDVVAAALAVVAEAEASEAAALEDSRVAAAKLAALEDRLRDGDDDVTTDQLAAAAGEIRRTRLLAEGVTANLVRARSRVRTADLVAAEDAARLYVESPVFAEVTAALADFHAAKDRLAALLDGHRNRVHELAAELERSGARAINTSSLAEPIGVGWLGVKIRNLPRIDGFVVDQQEVRPDPVTPDVRRFVGG